MTAPVRPPRLAAWLLARSLGGLDAVVVPGDLAETYADLAAYYGVRRADRWYWSQVLRSLPIFVARSFYWQGVMFKNYLTTALRNLRKQKGYAFINVAGLAVGLACCLLIGLYVLDELRYDRHHAAAERIYRVNMTFHAGDQARQVVSTPSALAPYLRHEVAGVETAVRFYQLPPVVVAHEDRRFQETGFLYADSTVFDVFTIPFHAGTPEQALTRPNTIVLTESAARKYFGADDPLGQTLTLNNGRDFEVTGVVADPPRTSHLPFDFLASWTTLSGWAETSDTQIRAANFLTYVLADPGVDGAAIQRGLDGLIERYTAQAGNPDFRLDMAVQPLLDVHLYTDFDDETGTQGNIAYVYGILAIGALILLIACINYMNLATARAAQRAKEVGMRKALGAVRSQLTGQFFGESAMMTLLALGIAVLLVVMVLPAFNQLTGKTLTAAALGTPWVLALTGGLWIVVSLAAGSYPALYLSRFRPSIVLKGVPKTGGGAAFLRKGLVVLQFAISVFLIIGTLVVYQQIQFVQTTSLGFDEDQIVVLPMRDGTLRAQVESLENELTQHTGILRVAAASAVPGNVRAGYQMHREATPDDAQLMVGLYADDAYVETLGLTVVAGRSFTTTLTTEEARERGYEFILNERAAALLGFATPEEAVGQRVGSHGRYGTIVGVVQDFHFASLRDDIRPLFLFNADEGFNHLLVKVQGTDIAGTMDYIEQTWARIAPHRPFDYTFLDQSFDALYRTERRVGELFALFAVLAIVIACLGLFGLAAFTAQQRTKEIGVRKVLGATVPGLMVLLAQDFLKLVLVSLVVAVPVAYVVMDRWLADFAYRIDVGVGTFVLAGVLALVIAIATVSYQAFRAARVNPVEALRYE